MAARKKKTVKKVDGKARKTPRTKKASRSASKEGPVQSARAALIHCTVAAMDKENVLLPTSVVEELVDYAAPEPIDSTPEWLLGQVEWNNRQVPVFSYPALINGHDAEDDETWSHTLIIKSLGDSARVPYLGIPISDIPSMDEVGVKDLVHLGDDKKSLGVFSRVSLRDAEAVIPDLDRLTHLVTHAAYGALPITQLDD